MKRLLLTLALLAATSAHAAEWSDWFPYDGKVRLWSWGLTITPAAGSDAAAHCNGNKFRVVTGELGVTNIDVNRMLALLMHSDSKAVLLGQVVEAKVSHDPSGQCETQSIDVRVMPE